MTDKETSRRIYTALNQLMTACGYNGESGTEKLFHVLSEATQIAEIELPSVLEKSRKEGLCYDVNAWLADTMAQVTESFEASGEFEANERPRQRLV